MSLVAITFALVLVSLAGAHTSVQVREGWPWWSPVIPGMVSYFTWSLAVQRTNIDLVVLSAWWDVVVALTWFVGFWMLGEKISLAQWLGVVLLCAGMALVNWRS